MVVEEKESHFNNNKTVAETGKKLPDNFTASNSIEIPPDDAHWVKPERTESEINVNDKSAAGIEQVKHADIGKKARMQDLKLQKVKKQNLGKNGNFLVDTKELLFAIFLPVSATVLSLLK